MLMFYWAILQRIIIYGITEWFGNPTVQLKIRLASMHIMAMKVIRNKEYEPTETN